MSGLLLGPGLVAIGPETSNPLLGMAFKKQGSAAIEFMYQAAGTPWTAPVEILGSATNTGPTLGYLNRTVYMLWEGESPDTLIWLRYLKTVEAGWSGQQPLGVHTAAGPSFGYHDGSAPTLSVAWRGATNQSVNVGGLQSVDANNNPPTLAGAEILGIGSSACPAIQTMPVWTDGALPLSFYELLAWKGESADTQIWFSARGFPNQQVPGWMRQVPGPGNTSSSPAMAWYVWPKGAGVLLAWKNAADETIRYSRLDSAESTWPPAWSAQQVARDSGGAFLTSVAPSLASWQGGVAMAWKGMEGDNRIWMSHYDPAADSFGPQSPVPGAFTGP
jgi:hypothetical protein